MNEEQVIEMKVSDRAKSQIMNRVTQAHVRGMDFKKAEELGIFTRMSLLLCGMHSLSVTAYKLYGGVNYLLEILGADNKHDIRVACTRFQNAVDDYMGFWTRYYSHNCNAVKEMNENVEELYHQFMRWAQLPESWALGDPQFTPDDTDTMLQIDESDENRLLKFHRSVIREKNLTDVKESWMVTEYCRKTRKQVSVEENMDKASAQMVAKRLSVEHPENIYTASCVREYTQEVAEIYPIKAFKGGATVGTIRRVFKKD